MAAYKSRLRLGDADSSLGNEEYDMNLRQQIKRNAKAALAGHWGRAIAIFFLIVAVWLLFMGIQQVLMLILHLEISPQVIMDKRNMPSKLIVIAIVTNVLYVISLFVFSPMLLGVVGWFYELGGGKPEPIPTVFDFFGSFPSILKAVWLYLNITIRGWLWALLTMVPVGLVSLILWRALNAMAISAHSAVMLMVACIWGLVVCLTTAFFVIIIYQRYFLVPYLILSMPELSVGDAIRLSVQGTKGERTKLAVFHISFYGWTFLGIVLWPLLLYVVPYKLTAYGLYARYLVCAKKIIAN